MKNNVQHLEYYLTVIAEINKSDMAFTFVIVIEEITHNQLLL